MPAKYTIEEQVTAFWRKAAIDETDFACWLWVAGRYKSGYGKFGLYGKTHNAHRVAYSLAFGEFPQSLHVLHHCDNPSCVNPNHLFLGTDIDNARDKIQKGRYSRHSRSGESNGNHKVTQDIVIEIRQAYIEGGLSYSQLSKRFHVSKTQIARIINGDSWA